MTFSGLIRQSYSTKQQSSRQGARIDMIICHHAATTNAAQVISQEVNGSRQVSSNYVIDRFGNIDGVVPEEYRAWTSGSASDGGKGAAMDRRAITFECADESLGGSWPISAASQEAIVNLLVDLHQRYGIPLDRDHVVGHRELWERWRASYPTSCPGGMNLDDLVNRARAKAGQPAIAPVGGGASATLADPEGGHITVNRSVRDVQQFLASHGFSVGATGVDGQLGPNTERAIKAFQSANGLDDDGIWGPLTDAKAFGGTTINHPATPTTQTVIAHGIGAPTFPLPAGSYFGPKSGPVQSVSGYFSHSGDLRIWQQRMRDRGWNITVDGLYGPETAAVAHHFQAQKNLTVDGLIGPQTWAAAWTADITAA